MYFFSTEEGITNAEIYILKSGSRSYFFSGFGRILHQSYSICTYESRRLIIQSEVYRASSSICTYGSRRLIIQSEVYRASSSICTYESKAYYSIRGNGTFYFSVREAQFGSLWLSAQFVFCRGTCSF